MNTKSYQYDTIARAIQYVRANHQEQPTLEELAKHVHLSKFHFQRLFRQWAGVSPKEFLQYITIEQAKKSLQLGTSTLETAYQVGLSGNGRLHDLFIKMEACTPGQFKLRGEGLAIDYDIIETPFGLALIAETNKGICKMSFISSLDGILDLLKCEFPNATFTHHLGKNGNLVQQYFQDWKIPQGKIGLDIKGTPFQIQVWKALLKISSAQNLSYTHIAQQINNPKAVRAVGTAIGKNPVAYLIPCHRVIRSNGEIGDYHWNKNRKIAINGYECLHLR